MRFRRGLDRGNVTEALSAASELEHVGLAEALELCLLLRDKAPERFPRAALRWHGRLCREVDVTLEEARAVLAALRSWPVSGRAMPPSRLRTFSACEGGISLRDTCCLGARGVERDRCPITRCVLIVGCGGRTAVREMPTALDNGQRSTKKLLASVASGSLRAPLVTLMRVCAVVSVSTRSQLFGALAVRANHGSTSQPLMSSATRPQREQDH